MELEEQQYKAAFNAGYLLAEHEPAIMAGIRSSTRVTNTYFEGLVSGQEQYELDAKRALLTELDDLRNSSKNRSRDLDR